MIDFILCFMIFLIIGISTFWIATAFLKFTMRGEIFGFWHDKILSKFDYDSVPYNQLGGCPTCTTIAFSMYVGFPVYAAIYYNLKNDFHTFDYFLLLCYFVLMPCLTYYLYLQNNKW
jgi:hypothetical protein